MISLSIDNVVNAIRNIKRKLFDKIYVKRRSIDLFILKNKHEDLSGDGGTIVIPCDPWSLTGSRGDEAMLMVISERYRGKLYVITATSEADKSATEHGWIPIRGWLEHHLLWSFYDTLRKIRPSRCIILGADVIDGYYSPRSSLALLSLASISFANNISTHLTGFSFNSAPSHEVIKFIRHMDRNFVFNLRDPISKERFEKGTGREVKLTADTAFLLAPNTNSEYFNRIEKWKSESGKKLLAINLHPMLRKRATEEDVKMFIDSMVLIIKIIMEKTDRIILLLPHDDRKGIGDNVCLLPIFRKVDALFGDRIKIIEKVLEADKIKGILTLVDMLMTSRMHLGIAGLSLGIPTVGFQYQDKLAGVFRHFGFEDECILPKLSCDNVNIIVERLITVMQSEEMFRTRIMSKIEYVKKLAEDNFS